MCRTAGRRTVGCRTSGRRTDVRWKSEESQMDVGCPTDIGWKSDESSMDVGRAELSRRYCDGRWRRCTAAPGNATLRRGRQSVAIRCHGEADRTLQLVAVARSAAGCSSLLRQWPAALQLAALGRQRCNSRRWPTMRYSLGQRCAAAFLFFFTRQLQERKRERQKEKGRESVWNLFKDLHFVGWHECNTQAPSSTNASSLR